MDVDEKLINNIISYFADKKIIEEFKKVFLEELKKDEQFQEKLKGMLDLDEVTPGDEVLWKKIIESDVNILSPEAREKLFKKFERILHEIFQSTESSAG